MTEKQIVQESIFQPTLTGNEMNLIIAALWKLKIYYQRLHSQPELEASSDGYNYMINRIDDLATRFDEIVKEEGERL